MGEDLVHESERLVQSRVAGSASLLHTGDLVLGQRSHHLLRSVGS